MLPKLLERMDNGWTTGLSTARSHNRIVPIAIFCKLGEFLFNSDTKHDIQVDFVNCIVQGKQGDFQLCFGTFQLCFGTFQLCLMGFCTYVLHSDGLILIQAPYSKTQRSISAREGNHQLRETRAKKFGQQK